MQKANIGVSSSTSVSTLVSDENKDGYSFRVAIRIAERKRPIKNEVTTATTNENLAVLGWAAPNSFDTLTLQNISVFNFSVFLKLTRNRKIAWWRCVSVTNLIAAFTPRATIIVQPNMFMLRHHWHGKKIENGQSKINYIQSTLVIRFRSMHCTRIYALLCEEGVWSQITMVFIKYSVHTNKGLVNKYY